MIDSQTTIAQLRQLVNDFVEGRDWHQFHSPKNLAMSISIEAAELMEHFQWVGSDESRSVVDDEKKLSAVSEELADVVCYVLAMANELGLDLSASVRDKMGKNERKYPAEEFRGRFGSDDPNPPAV